MLDDWDVEHLPCIDCLLIKGMPNDWGVDVMVRQIVTKEKLYPNYEAAFQSVLSAKRNGLPQINLIQLEMSILVKNMFPPNVSTKFTEFHKKIEVCQNKKFHQKVKLSYKTRSFH